MGKVIKSPNRNISLSKDKHMVGVTPTAKPSSVSIKKTNTAIKSK